VETGADEAALGRGQDFGAAVGLLLRVGAAHEGPLLRCGK
jgi:hypothetical protein